MACVESFRFDRELFFAFLDNDSKGFSRFSQRLPVVLLLLVSGSPLSSVRTTGSTTATTSTLERCLLLSFPGLLVSYSAASMYCLIRTTGVPTERRL